MTWHFRRTPPGHIHKNGVPGKEFTGYFILLTRGLAVKRGTGFRNFGGRLKE